MFSIIIPLYNKEQSITNTLNSVLNQTYKVFEVVIVNDGSTDKSVEKVLAINDSRIRVIHQDNQGVSSARNKGINEAKYDWIAFLDADDLWENNKLQLVADAIFLNQNLDLILHAFDTKFISKNKSIISNLSSKKKNSPLINLITSGFLMQTSAVIVKKELFFSDQELFFRKGMNNSEDREVWYKLALLDVKYFYISEVLSHYVIYSTGSSLTSNDKNFEFLSMENRLQGFPSNVSLQDLNLFFKFLRNHNEGQIANYWVNLDYFPKKFVNHVSKVKTLFFKNTIKLPRIIKATINRLAFQKLL